MYIEKYMYPWRNWRTIPLNLCTRVVIQFHLPFVLRISETGGKKYKSNSDHKYKWSKWRNPEANGEFTVKFLTFCSQYRHFDWEIEGKKYESDSGRKYKWENREILMTNGNQNEVANARWDKTGSGRTTNEGEWLTPTSEWSLHVHYSNKHPFIVISIEKGWVLCLESKIPSSWGVRSPDWLSSQSGNLTTCRVIYKIIFNVTHKMPSL